METVIYYSTAPVHSLNSIPMEHMVINVNHFFKIDQMNKPGSVATICPTNS